MIIKIIVTILFLKINTHGHKKYFSKYIVNNMIKINYLNNKYVLKVL